ncbi:3-mercaptopyruvate sulfurtransferase [Asticcacaulis sp. AND118]|uniref:3-mercaptopyruvate sulfurtransferase n=1 Tax=Asticcacaulis sp. AND118 TaxID=2840468 RepID=UPI001CFF6659|nr:3-mercaptopyruvate sulfurtransferase [Asticcacaulis sp. AND118]UDF02372.1 3-mercaptopyruvate sulfurtransferase [Asticcacaulis sp. AND118]
MTAQIDADALKALLDRGEVKIVDGSWALDGTDMAALYGESHIPTAQFFDIEAISDPSSGLPHMAPTPEVFAKAVGDMGIRETDHVVIYDRQGLFSAARVWWTFRLMGHEKVQVLRGGLPAWIAAGYPVLAGAGWIKGVNYTPSPKLDRVIEINTLRAHLGASDERVLDARPGARFDGSAPEPRAGLRSGHMPGSRSLPATELIRDGALKPVDELKNIFGALHITPKTQVITSCGSGVTAAIIALALHEIGHHKVRLYDGSWAEWGREDLDTPVVRSDQRMGGE